MKLKVAYEYIGYDHERPVAYGEDEIAKLDLTAQTIHYSVWCDTIVERGMDDKYRISEIDLPAWADPKRWMTDWQYRSNCIELQDLPDCDTNPAYAKLAELSEVDCKVAVALLAVKRFKNPFFESLRCQLESWLHDTNPKYTSPLSYKQRDAVCRSYHIRY